MKMFLFCFFVGTTEDEKCWKKGKILIYLNCAWGFIVKYIGNNEAMKNLQLHSSRFEKVKDFYVCFIQKNQL